MQRQSSAKELRARVRAYHKNFGRHTLPWRKNKAPYCVFVSEYMLQQTGVERVIPKFNAFIKKFPTFKKLARATLPEVLSLWQGLGYNRRAKYLRDAAVRIVGEKGGVLPNDREYLQSLPGIGPYTAGAIQAFAFGNPEPFVETNIRTTVIHHCFSKKRLVRDADVLAVLKSLTPPRGTRARQWYAALMDYGAYLKKEGHRLNARSFHYVKQKPFKGSRRELRGLLMRSLLSSQKTDKELAHTLTKSRADIRTELVRLEKEGLVKRGVGEGWKLAR